MDEIQPDDDIVAVIDVTVDLNDATKDPSQGANDAEDALRDRGFNDIDSESTFPLFLFSFEVTTVSRWC